MKEFKFEDMSPIKTIERQIWKMFDILRGNSISSEDYYVILLFLSLYKDNQISRDFLFGESQINLEEVRIQSDTNSIKPENDYAKIIESLNSSLLNLRNKGFKELIDALFQIDKTILKENFSEIFDFTLFRITQSQGRYGGEFIQPLELTRFICALADLPEKSKVFNPFAGLASFSVFLDKGQTYFGQEINQKTWAIGTLRLMAYAKTGNTHYVCEDSILNWPKENEKFDLVVSHPPFGLRLNRQYRTVDPVNSTIEQFLIEKGVNSLNAKGKLIALLPQGFLFRGMHEQRLREHLIEGDFIDTIISLPGGLLLNTGIPLIVLVINKDKKLPGKIRFIDATKFVESKGIGGKVLNDIELLKYIHANKNETNGNDISVGFTVQETPVDYNRLRNSPQIGSTVQETPVDYNGLRNSPQKEIQNLDVERIVHLNKIREFKYNLNVPRYFQKDVEGTKLKDIVEFVRGSRRGIPEAGKMIRIRDLKDDKLDFLLDVSSVEKTEFRRPHLRTIDESCLLLATRWKTLKPTYFEFSGVPIFLNPDILSFKINEQVVDTAYLINELHADYVEEQLASYRQGETIPMIRPDDLLEIVIKLPSLEEQRAKVQGIVELSDKIKTLQRERNALAHGKAASQFNEFASLKHTLGRPRQNILDWTDNLLHFLKDKPDGFNSLNKAFLEFYETDILSALQEIKRDVNFMTEVLEKGENGLILNNYEIQLISIQKVLKKVQSLCNSHKYNFVSIPPSRIIEFDNKEVKSLGIKVNLTLLEILIDNIFSNAHKHSFQNRAFNERQHVFVELGISDNGFFLNISIEGKPFPKNMDKEKFIQKYNTSDIQRGTGIGGYDINRIADYFNSEWFLKLNKDPFLPVQFSFWFELEYISS